MKRISMTYGQVLFELGIKKESLQKAQDMLHENEELLSALENPTITKKEKENVVEKLFSDDIKSFLKVVCDNDDIACFEIGFNNEVKIIHDFASAGYEQKKKYQTFWDWFKDAIEEMIEYGEYE